MPRFKRLTPRAVAAGVLGFVLVAVPAAVLSERFFGEAVPSFEAQVCGLPPDHLELMRRGHRTGRSAQISILPRTPMYMASGGNGWSHSGPWAYLQEVPLVFYGPGIVPATGEVDTPATLADIAPTLATLLRGNIETDDGQNLDEVARLDASLVRRAPPRLIVTIVWDGAGWNVLEQWPGDWSNLLAMMEGGVSYSNAIVGSSPSVTPAVHTTLGTGVFPATHGVTGISVLDDDGAVADAFDDGESGRFMEVPALAERWDENNGNRVRVAMLGYVPWHLGMIGMGAERAGGDKDDAVWVDNETSEWVTNPEHYRLPRAIEETQGLDEDLERLDAADGNVDGAWLDNATLEDAARVEETPAFVEFHERALENLITKGGYGDDAVTDLIFTNFKQMDVLGHAFNMESEEVNAALLAKDRALRDLLRVLDEDVGRGNYVVVLTADHGQQPDAPDIGGYGIDPQEIEADLEREFGPITQTVWPTEVFVDERAMNERGVTLDDVARFLGGYRIRDNNNDDDPTGRFEDTDRVFELAVPSTVLDVDCAVRAETARGV